MKLDERSEEWRLTTETHDKSASPSGPQNKRAEAAENDLMRLAKLLPRDGKSHILPIAERVANYIADLKATIAKDSPAVSPGAEVTRIAPHFPTADKSVEYSGEAAEPERDAPDSINYLEIHHTDGRVKVWYGEEARGRFRGIDHDPTTKEEWKRMAGEGVRTIEALTANSGERQAEREAAMDAIERVIEMADSYKTASQMTLSDARNALKYFRASAAPLKQTGWVSVKDRMPPDNPKQSWQDHGTYRASEIVIAFNGFQTTAEVLTNPKGESSWVGVAGDQILTGVTHWHELPDDPHAASQPQPSAGQVIFHSLREVAQSHHFDTDGVCTCCNMSDSYTQSYGIICPSAGQTEGK